MKIILLFCFILPFLASCGGGGGSSSNPTSTGVFVDSPVINIGYRTETQNGVTNSRGEFKYFPGETVTFFIGDLEFPSVLADERVTPLDMADTDDVFHPTWSILRACCRRWIKTAMQAMVLLSPIVRETMPPS